MYYFSEIEFMQLRKLVQESYLFQIDENLRGWNWDKAPLMPPYSNIFLSAWELSTFCPNFRDIIIRRKFNIRLPVSESQILGFYVHKLIQKIFSIAKKEIYVDLNDIYERLKESVPKIIDETVQNLKNILSQSKIDIEKLKVLGKSILNFEISRICNKIEEILVNYPFANLETIAFKAIPVNTEILVDGSLLGFSKMLRVDAFGSYGNVIFEVKIGRPNYRHKLQVTAYALCLEANYFVPVNVGVIVYVNIHNNRFSIQKEIFPISEELRIKVTEIRDEIMRMLKEEKLPDLPKSCPKNCLLKDYCLKL